MPDPFEHRNDRIFHVAFEPADISPIAFGIHRERFLRDPFSDAKAAQIPRDEGGCGVIAPSGGLLGKSSGRFTLVGPH
jgi:hypothetical protein